MHTTASSSLWRRLLGGALLTAAPLFGWAQQPQPQPQPIDPPARVAYISALDGSAWIVSPGDGDGFQVAPNWPVTTGTRLTLDPGARAELDGGWTVLRLSGQASLDVTLLDDAIAQVALTEGALLVRVRALEPGERVEIDTPQLAVLANQPGEYRIDVDPDAGTTTVTVRSGDATAFGDAGQSDHVTAGQLVTFSSRSLNVVGRGPAFALDALDQWAAQRDALQAQSASASYVSRDMPGYQMLDNYGQWDQDPNYGAVWYPAVDDSDWAPYRDGDWAWVEPWGWTWVDAAPWGFAPFHYGRWAQIGPRWAWVPGPMSGRPVYAPALVGFIGGGSGGAQWGLSIGGGQPAAAWFPLAPGEYWQPGYRVSDRYRSRLNAGLGARPPASGYRYQSRPGAISVAPPGDFGNRAPRGQATRFTAGSRLPAGALGSAKVVAPPSRANAAVAASPRSAAQPTAPGPNVARSPAAGRNQQAPGNLPTAPRQAAPQPRPANDAPYNGIAAPRPAAPTGVGTNRNPPREPQPSAEQARQMPPRPGQAEPTPRPQNNVARPQQQPPQRPVEQRPAPPPQQRAAPSPQPRATPERGSRPAGMSGERHDPPATQRDNNRGGRS